MARQLVLDDREWIEITDPKGTVTGGFFWNPSDLDIVNRCESVLDYFEKLKLPAGSDYEALDKMSEEVKGQFNRLLNSDSAADELFKNCKNVFSPREDGQFFAEYVLNVLVKFIESELDVRFKKTSAKVQKYTRKYHK